ncbi:MAG: hypothetical protein HY821_06170 [Acidobacteria bacterium]|nr:hypothetical protein [Acidobacteriota bacterium]
MTRKARHPMHRGEGKIGPNSPDAELRSELRLLLDRHTTLSAVIIESLRETQGETRETGSAEPGDVDRMAAWRAGSEMEALSRRVAELEEEVAAVKALAASQSARVDALAHSRTWRLLTYFGGLWLRVTGRS